MLHRQLHLLLQLNSHSHSLTFLFSMIINSHVFQQKWLCRIFFLYNTGLRTWLLFIQLKMSTNQLTPGFPSISKSVKPCDVKGVTSPTLWTFPLPEPPFRLVYSFLTVIHFMSRWIIPFITSYLTNTKAVTRSHWKS